MLGVYYNKDMTKPKNIIEVSGLTKRYGGKAVVKNISFSVREGEIFGVLGPNGAGKTTFLKTILGQIPTYAGETRLGSSLY